MKFIIVGLGGFIGAVLRYVIDLSFTSNAHSFPKSTFIANILGCFLAGILISTVFTKIDSQNIKLFLFTGILGALTTFSTFSVQSLEMILNGNFLQTLIYIFSSIGFGLLAVFIGTQV